VIKCVLPAIYRRSREDESQSLEFSLEVALEISSEKECQHHIPWSFKKYYLIENTPVQLVIRKHTLPDDDIEWLEEYKASEQSSCHITA
jgi:hypothetical protein